MQSDHRFANLVWLMPDRENRAYFHSFITALAKQVDAPVFEPHLTLGKVDEQVLRGSFMAGAIELEATGIFTSSVFTKTLFVRFAAAPALLSLRSSLGMRTNDYDPHLSLLYCQLPPAGRQRLAATIPLPPEKVTFDRLTVVRCPEPTTTRADVEAWVQLGSRELKGT